MPRQVDHAQRRHEIAEALWRVVADQGVHAVSLRHVAAEAGVSMGLVQHYFSSRNEMILFAMDVIAERVTREYTAALEELDDPGPRDRVRLLLGQWLPLDDRRTPDARSMFAYMMDGPDARLGDWAREGVEQLRAGVVAEVTAAGHASDPQLATTILLALADGLTAHVQSGQLSRREAVTALESGLDTAFGPEGGPA